MAVLQVPTVAFQVKDGQKFHLENANHGSGRNPFGSQFRVSVCNKIIGDNETSLLGTPISEIQAEQLCACCLGSIRAVDPT